jgi:hypothetical protein
MGISLIRRLCLWLGLDRPEIGALEFDDGNFQIRRMSDGTTKVVRRDELDELDLKGW